MAYLSVEQYKEMGGSLSDTAFLRYAFMATKRIDRDTFGRVAKMASVPDEVELLMFELVELNAKADMTVERVKSESVGSWSQSYGEVDGEAYEKERRQLVRTYLSQVTDEKGTPLLYLGVE